MRNNFLAGLAGTLILAGLLAFMPEGHAQQPVRVCTPVWNATTGTASCVDVGQTRISGDYHGLLISALGVASCGTPASTGTAGLPFPLTVDIATGELCGAGGGGSGGAVTIANGADVTQGAIADTAYAGSGNATVVAGLKGIYAAIVAGSGGAVTIANGADVTQGAVADGAWAGSGNGTVVAILKAVYGAVTGSIPAGSAVIGKVSIDQTTPGTTNLVQIGSTLPAFAAIPTVKIDQTTPGTTNAVSVTNFPTTVSVGTGTQGASSPRVTVATDTASIAGSAPGTAGTASANVVTVQGVTSMTPVQVSQATAASLNATVTGSGTAGTAASGVVSVQGIASMTPILTSEQPTTSGGLSVYFVQPTASDNHVVIKAGAGQVYKISVTNNSATINYLRLYNATTGFNGCNSATNLVYQMAIPANSTNGAGYSDSWESGIAFATGISICVSSGYATTDTTNATSSAMSVNVGYK